MSVERLTIDSTVVIDLVDERQEQHQLAQRLVVLARTGEVELAVASSGHIFDAKDHAAERLSELARQGVLETVQLAYPGVMIPGANAIPGAGVPGFRAAWDAVAATWKTHEGRCPGDNDALHVETHVLTERDVFVTDDRALRAMCRRLTEEHPFTVTAVSLAQYLSRREPSLSPDVS
jgi:hypothetical protein